jgi:hypothetical protein
MIFHSRRCFCLIVIFALCLVVEASNAQTTWKGLKFGMTEEEVRKVFSSTLDKENLAKGRYALLNRSQNLFDTRATAKFYFSADGKLDMISVFMLDPFANDPNPNQAEAKTIEIIETANKELTGKYGNPLSVEGDCAVTVESVMSSPTGILICDKLFKSEGQGISLGYSVKHERLSTLGITYKPLSSEI